MNRTLAGFALILTLMTGLVLGRLATLDSAWPEPVSDSSAASIQGAYEFYEAINDFLSTGNPTRLRSVLQPGFVDHSLLAGQQASGADLEKYIDSLRLASPGSRLTATPVAREPGLVAVSVTSELQPVNESSRLRFDSRGIFPEFDLLRIRDAKVIERWSFPVAPQIGHAESLATVTIPRSPLVTGFILQRFTLDSLEQLDFLHESGIVILTESGEVTCQSIATSALEHTQETQESCRRHVGSTIIVESGRSIRLTNPGHESVNLLALRLRTDDSHPEDGQAVAYGSFDGATGGPLQVGVQEVYLAPGNSIADHSVIGDEVVLTITGEIRISTRSVTVERLDANGQMAEADSPLVATAGDAFRSLHGSTVAWQNTSDEDAVVLVFSIAPAATAATGSMEL